ncbi:MAG: hypothetical protein ACE5HZ_07985 [Fidelibacterota bacterium]
MKISIPLLLLTGFPLAAFPGHHVISMGGKTEVGTVLSMTDDFLTFRPLGQETAGEIALDTVLYVHNGAGKLFFVSKRLESFLERARGRGGRLVTVDGREIPFSELRPELFMFNPRVGFLAAHRDEWHSLPLERLHRIVVDRSLSEFAVRKGFYAGMGISLLRFLVKFGRNRQLSRVPTYAVEVYPGLVTVTPLATLGWIVYDFFLGERELVINPSGIQRSSLSDRRKWEW